MKKIFKKNQIIITALALMIAVAGYINYSDNIKNKNKNKEDTVQSGTNLEGETDPVSGDIQSNDAEPNNPYDDPGSMVFTSNVTSQFIISAKLEREQVRASGKETLLEVINNSEVSEDMKAEAVSGMVALADAAEKEAAAELLLEAKGFQNVIVSVSGNQVDVVVESNDLSATQLAQIEDIVTRKTSCALENLTITSVTPAKDDSAATGGEVSDNETEADGGENSGENPEDEAEPRENETANLQ
ncbi:MAG: SpoIIIAH-like family protein [Butyrivibrio sp.]|nr:SpoIIIAH-like family protein [Butyrivibrio sp.]